MRPPLHPDSSPVNQCLQHRPPAGLRVPMPISPAGKHCSKAPSTAELSLSGPRAETEVARVHPPNSVMGPTAWPRVDCLGRHLDAILSNPWSHLPRRTRMSFLEHLHKSYPLFLRLTHGGVDKSVATHAGRELSLTTGFPLFSFSSSHEG